MLSTKFVFLAATLNVAGSSRYIVSTLRGHTKPNRASWGLWTLITFAAFSAELSEGVGLQSLMTFMVALEPLMVFLMSFRNSRSYWKLGSLDWLCVCLSLLAIVLWAITQSGSFALALLVLADALAAIPTIVKAAKYPESEDYVIFLCSACSALITLLSVDEWTFATYAFPAYILGLGALLTALITMRRSPSIAPAGQSAM